MDLLKERKVSDVLKEGGKSALMVILGGGIYFLVSKMVGLITGIEEQSRTSVYLYKKGQFLLFKYVRLIPYAMERMVKTFIHDAYPRKVLCVLLAVTLLCVGEVFDTDSDYGTASSIKGLANNMQISQDTSAYYYNAYKAYFDYVLNYPIELVDDETHAKLKESKKVQELPTFPQKGCVQMMDGVLVVKMGTIKK